MFFPKKSKIMEPLAQHAALVNEAAEIFFNISCDWTTLKSGCVKLAELEREADELVHVISDNIEQTFILPFDKEDCKELSEQLDDIVDYLEETVSLLERYEIREGNAFLIEAADLIRQATGTIHQFLEDTLDTCEGLAITFERLRLKYR